MRDLTTTATKWACILWLAIVATAAAPAFASAWRDGRSALTIDLQNPAEGAAVPEGLFAYEVNWNARLGALPYEIDLELSTNGGTTWTDSGHSTQKTHYWSRSTIFIPTTPSKDCYVRVRLTDAAGAVVQDMNGPFEIAPTGAVVNPFAGFTTPRSGDTDVLLDTNVEIWFSDPMDLTATEAAFSVAPATAGTLSWGSKNRLLFDPATDLSPGTIYWLSVSDAAKDATGVPMAADYDLSFYTVGSSNQELTSVQVIPSEE